MTRVVARARATIDKQTSILIAAAVHFHRDALVPKRVRAMSVRPNFLRSHGFLLGHGFVIEVTTTCHALTSASIQRLYLNSPRDQLSGLILQVLTCIAACMRDSPSCRSTKPAPPNQAGVPAFHGLSRPRDVTNELVFAGEGKPEDFAMLKREGMSVQANVVFA